jgi:hypothetical protein
MIIENIFNKKLKRLLYINVIKNSTPLIVLSLLITISLYIDAYNLSKKITTYIYILISAKITKKDISYKYEKYKNQKSLA